MALLQATIIKKIRRSDGAVTLICRVAGEKNTHISSYYNEEWGELPKNGEECYLEAIPQESGRILYSYIGGSEIEDDTPKKGKKGK